MSPEMWAAVERIALAGGAPASIIVMLLFIEALVIKLVPTAKYRTPIVYGLCAIQGLAAVLWLVLSTIKTLGD